MIPPWNRVRQHVGQKVHDEAGVNVNQQQIGTDAGGGSGVRCILYRAARSWMVSR